MLNFDFTTVKHSMIIFIVLFYSFKPILAYIGSELCNGLLTVREDIDNAKASFKILKEKWEVSDMRRRLVSKFNIVSTDLSA